MRTGTCVALIAVGAILAFAITGSSFHGLNFHVVGVILILVGVLGLVLSLVVWGPLNPARRQRDHPLRYDDGTPLPVVEERRVYQEQGPVVEERLVYLDEPPL